MNGDGPESTVPGGDLSEHGADADARRNDEAARGRGETPAEPSDEPGGDLTEHGADPSAR
jgi:hypothetical protein